MLLCWRSFAFLFCEEEGGAVGGNVSDSFTKGCVGEKDVHAGILDTVHTKEFLQLSITNHPIKFPSNFHAALRQPQAPLSNSPTATGTHRKGCSVSQ